MVIGSRSIRNVDRKLVAHAPALGGRKDIRNASYT